MAKRQCDPTSGSIGLQVYVPGRNGQVVRIRAIPSNPRTTEQLAVRQSLASIAGGWRALTENQRAAWIAAALNYNSKSRLGQSGPLTGEQLYCRVNFNLSAVGEPAVTAPPDLPTFDSNIVQSLELLNPGGVPSIKLVCSGSSDAFNLVSACPPMSAGRHRAYGLNYLGELPEVVTGKADITTLFNAKFGAPVAGQKIWVQSQQTLDGFQDLPMQLSGVVPAAS